MHNQKFYDEISEITNSYDGDYAILIRNTSNLLKLLSDSIEFLEHSDPLRLQSLAVMGYFVLPNDLYPESELGAKGYIDDVMALVHILKKIETKYDTSSLEAIWPLDADVLYEILGEQFQILIKNESKLYNELLAYLDI